MIGGKLENGDVLVEIEDKKTYNVAPLVVAAQERLTAMYYGSFSWGNYTVYRPGNSGGGPGTGGLRRLYAPWVKTGPDAFGNYKYSLSGTSMAKKVIGLQMPTSVTGVAGKYYSVTVDIATFVTAMPGAFDYVTQPPAYINLYASNGTEAQDVLIARSPQINPSNPANQYYNFHPGKRDSQVLLSPVAPMPVGKLYFRLEVEHDYDWTATRDIWLPQNYFGSGNPLPPQLAFWEIDFDSANLFEESSGVQEWVSSASRPTKYDWRAQSISTPGYTDGIQAEITIPEDSLIATEGGVFSFWTAQPTSSFTINVSGGSASSTITVPANAEAHWVKVPLATNLVDGDTVTIKVNLGLIAGPALYADIDADGTDGHNYYSYVDRVGSVSDITIQRYDSEVSTCALTLRDDTGIDVDETFAPGKAFRIRTNTDNNVVETTWGGVPMNYFSIVFQGTLENRRATYPRGARPEIKVLGTNSFTVLLEKTEYAFKALENYMNLFPYLGIVTVLHETGGINGAKPTDPNASSAGYADYTGLWRLRDDSLNMTMLDALFITRNSQFGYAYFDRYNRMILAGDAPDYTTVFTDQQPVGEEFSYSKLDLQYGTTNVINYVALTAFDHVISVDEDLLIHNNVVKTELSFFDEESIRKYRKAEYKLQMFNRVDFSDIQNKILDKYKDPVITASTLRFPVRTHDELFITSMIDMYETIHIKYQDKLDTDFRIHTIKHFIKPGETWITEYGFGLNGESPLWG